MFTEFIQIDNNNIRKKLKKLLFIYNRRINFIKLKYFYNFYYKALKLKLLDNKKSHINYKSISTFNNNKNCEKKLVNKTFISPLRVFLGKNHQKNKNILYKYNKNEIKKDHFNNLEINENKKIGKYLNNNKIQNHLLNDDSYNLHLKTKGFKNDFNKTVINKINNIIFNYINDVKNYNLNLKEKRKFLPRKGINIISGYKTFTNKMKNHEKFNFNDNQIIKNEEEKNSNIINDNKAININDNYKLNFSFINQHTKNMEISDFYKKEYNSSYLKDKPILIKTPNTKHIKNSKRIKTKILDINNNVVENIFNNNKYSNFSNSTKQGYKNKNTSKKFSVILQNRIINKIQNNENPMINQNNNIIKRNIYYKIKNTRNFIDNYNNPFLTIYNKDKKMLKDIGDSAFYSTEKDTSKRNYLSFKKNISNSKEKHNRFCLNKKNLIEENKNNFIFNNKNENFSNEKKKQCLGKNNSYFNMIKNKKEKLTNHNIVLQNLSLSNCSEQNNCSEKKNINNLQTQTTAYKNINKIIALDNINNKNDENNKENNSGLIEKEKIIETSSETLSDSKIYELAKLYIQKDEENIDKHIMNEILKSKNDK